MCQDVHGVGINCIRAVECGSMYKIGILRWAIYNGVWEDDMYNWRTPGA